MKIPEIDLSECILCEICVDVCPSVFTMSDAGYVQIADLSEYPSEGVEEAIKNCPADCIRWVRISGAIK